MVKHSLPLLLAVSSIAFINASQANDHAHDHNHEQHALDSHVHGMANLDIVLEDTMLLASIKAPAADLVGFEHVASTDEDTNKVYDMLGKMELANVLWTLPEAAQCERQETHVEHDLLENVDHSGHDHDHDHKHDDDHAHSDVMVDYYYECANPEQLGNVRVNLFDNFPSLHELQGQLILPSGQKGQTLTPSQNMIQFD